MERPEDKSSGKKYSASQTSGLPHLNEPKLSRSGSWINSSQKCVELTDAKFIIYSILQNSNFLYTRLNVVCTSYNITRWLANIRYLIVYLR